MKHIKLILLSFLVSNLNIISGEWYKQTKHFNLTKDPIDVVIACHEKDKYTLEHCILSVKKYVKNLRKIIVLSEKKLSDHAEWFNESLFPFSKESISKEFALMDPYFYENPNKIKRVGWYFKQIMNFYAAFIVPEISNNILILDADVIFCKPVEFTDNEGNMLHAPGKENVSFYFEHMGRLLPGLKKVIKKYSGISHHMLFQKEILKDLFKLVESYHKIEFWRAYCRCVESKIMEGSGAADYEIYFNFALMRTNQIKLRPLKWENITSLYLLPHFEKDFDFVSCHSYSRNSYELYIEELILNNCSLNIKDQDNNTPIMIAIKQDTPLLVKKILSYINNSEKLEFLNIKNNQGLSALHLAVKWNDEISLKELINNGADLYITDSKGNTPLFYCVIYGNLKMLSIIKDCLNNKQQFNNLINIKNKEGLTPLHYATQHKMLMAVKLLK